MALPWMVCEAYDRELFAQPRTRPATDLALSAAARENGFVSQLYERQNLLGGWSEGWEPLAEEEAAAAAETQGDADGTDDVGKSARWGEADGGRSADAEQPWPGLAGRDGLCAGAAGRCAPHHRAGDGPARASFNLRPADAPADPMALLEEWRTLLGVDVLPDWEETETVQAGATEMRSAQGRLRLQVCAAHETFLLEAASFS